MGERVNCSCVVMVQLRQRLTALSIWLAHWQNPSARAADARTLDYLPVDNRRKLTLKSYNGVEKRGASNHWAPIDGLLVYESLNAVQSKDTKARGS